jgi:hypothetical protein
MGDPLVYLLGFLVLAAIPLLIWVVGRIQEEHWKERAGLGDLGALGDAQFDEWVEALFTDLGYKVEPARGRESLGVDWILTDPRGVRTALQTRRWRQQVGAEGVQQVVGGAVFHLCDERLILSTVGFSREAERLGRQTSTKLWGIRELAGAREAAKQEALRTPRLPAPQSVTPDPMAKAPPISVKAVEHVVEQVAATSQPDEGLRCPRCRKLMVRRSVNGRPVMVCADFPRCTGARVKGDH